MTIPPAMIWLAQSAPVDPATLLTQFGAFGAAAAFLVAWLWDVRKDRNRLLTIVEQQQPILIETRDVLRTAAETVRAAGNAMQAMSEALPRLPTEAELTRLRVALEQAERAAHRAAPRGGEGM